MGDFEPKRKVYSIDFENSGELSGLEVKARSVPVGQFLDLTALAASERDAITRADVERMASLFAGFAGALVEWNLTNDGEPVPPTLEGIRSQEASFMLEVVFTWLAIIGDVMPPLGKPFNSGETSQAPPLPMEVQSPRQAS